MENIESDNNRVIARLYDEALGELIVWYDAETDKVKVAMEVS